MTLRAGEYAENATLVRYCWGASGHPGTCDQPPVIFSPDQGLAIRSGTPISLEIGARLVPTTVQVAAYFWQENPRKGLPSHPNAVNLTLGEPVVTRAIAPAQKIPYVLNLPPGHYALTLEAHWQGDARNTGYGLYGFNILIVK